MGETASVLIVDDEPRVLDSLEALLAMDYRVLRALEPKAALATLAETETAVIISDQRMPGMTGVELLARSREAAPDTVRILLTLSSIASSAVPSSRASRAGPPCTRSWNATGSRPGTTDERGARERGPEPGDHGPHRRRRATRAGRGGSGARGGVSRPARHRRRRGAGRSRP